MAKNGQGKISLNLWFHQSLDILWLVNGVIFVVLLFATGQWMRSCRRAGRSFPNAVSAALQYVSLDWPTENGWVNYNSLQQLAYFATVFIAAPLAVVTGVRMSGIWPKNAKTLNRIYPVEWARAVHFPVMLYFVAFIVVHVALVFRPGRCATSTTCTRRRMPSTGSGFWIFVASLVVIAAAGSPPGRWCSHRSRDCSARSAGNGVSPTFSSDVSSISVPDDPHARGLVRDSEAR